jgi:hypothetical protein
LITSSKIDSILSPPSKTETYLEPPPKLHGDPPHPKVSKKAKNFYKTAKTHYLKYYLSSIQECAHIREQNDQHYTKLLKEQPEEELEEGESESGH